MNRIIVIGSTNTDMVIKSKKLPAPGETILGGTFVMNQGGKGANQAVAASRLGGNVTFVTKVGSDMFGIESVKTIEKEGIDSRFIIIDNIQPSGVALINVDENGENCIVVAQGANGFLLPKGINQEVFNSDSRDIFLIQLEIPMETVEFAIKKAVKRESRVILNPAPAANLPNDMLNNLFCITPNETEAELLTGIKVYSNETAQKAALLLQRKGVRNVIITMGAAGAYLLNDTFSDMIPVTSVKAVDTTAAGDVFNGALAVALAEEMKIEDAVSFANKAASISVMRLGAQTSAPFRHEIT
jgi:ribokinase